MCDVPVKQSHYRMSPEKREKLREEVGFLLAIGLAETSDSEWASSCLLVTKPDMSRPTPSMGWDGKDDFVTKIDFLKGYYQDNSSLQTVSTMPFGLRNASATFQR